MFTIGLSLFYAIIVQCNCEINLKLFEQTITRKSELTLIHWDTIHWYLNRTTRIEITEILETNKQNHLPHSDEMIKEILSGSKLTGTQTSIMTYSIDQAYEEPNYTEADMFKPSGAKFKTRKIIRKNVDEDKDVQQQEPKRSNIKHIFHGAVINKMEKSKLRRDKPQLGAFVYIQTLSQLIDYLIGPPRHPFYKSLGYFVIAVGLCTELEWTNMAGNAMKKLWTDYRILNAIILFCCEEISFVGYYDPFEIIEQNHNQTLWGAMKWTNLIHIDDWIFRKDRNLNGHPLIASVFYRYPSMVHKNELPKAFLDSYFATAIKDFDFGGYDGIVLGNMIKVFNANVTPIIANRFYGFIFKNKSSTGAICHVLHGLADVAFNARFIQDYETKEIDFLYPILADRFCVVVPSALVIPGWRAIFSGFDVIVWFSIFLTYMICSLFWYILNLLFNNRRKTECRSLTAISIEMWYLLLAAPTKMPRRTIERIFIAACLLADIIIIGTFQGSLTKAWTKESFFNEIDTLKEMDKTGLPMVISSRIARNPFGDHNTSLFQSLKSKLFVRNVTAISQTAYYRNISTIERYSDINIIMKTKFEDSNGRMLLHVVRECPRKYHLAYICKKGWPFTDRFNRLLQRFYEAGFLYKWFDEVEDAFIVKKHNEELSEKKFSAFTLTNMQVGFYSLGIGCGISVLVFLLEIGFNRIKSSKFNKYLTILSRYKIEFRITRK